MLYAGVAALEIFLYEVKALTARSYNLISRHEYFGFLVHEQIKLRIQEEQIIGKIFRSLREDGMTSLKIFKG